jgi:hypothetical protein
VELSFSRTGEFSGILDHPLSRVMTRVTSASSSTCFAAGENLARADLQLVAHMTILPGQEIHRERDAVHVAAGDRQVARRFLRWFSEFPVSLRCLVDESCAKGKGSCQSGATSSSNTAPRPMHRNRWQRLSNG